MMTPGTTTPATMIYEVARHGDTAIIFVRHAQELPTSLSIQTVSNVAVAMADFPVFTDANVLPRDAQLDEIARLSGAGRHRASPLERSRFGWCDAPRRPGYRAARRR